MCFALFLSAVIFAGEVLAAQYKSEIIIARPEDSQNLDPVTQNGNINIWVFDLVMEGLLRTTDDGKGIEPLLAESYEVSDDFLTYTFKLKEGLVFSNGDPVQAEDLVWTYERAMNTEDSVWKDTVANFKSVEAPNDTTFIIRMKQPSPVSEPMFTFFTLLIGNKSYFEEVGLENYSKKPIGTGPYKFDEWRQGEYLRIVKNEKHRNADNVKTESIVFRVVPDDNSRIMQLQTGEVDVITFVPWNRMAEIDADPSLKVATFDATETRDLRLNCTYGPLQDVRVRRAIAMAINRNAIVRTVLFGYGKIADSLFASSIPYYSPVTVAPYDIDAAKALLAEAGHPNGFPLTLTLRAGNVVEEQIGTLVKEQLAAIGINITIETFEAGTFVNLRNNLKLQAFFGGYTSDIPDPSQQSNYYNLPTMAKCALTGWENERAIALAQSATLEMDPVKRAQLYAELLQNFANEAPTIAIYYAPYPVAMRAKVSGFAQTPLGNYRLGNLYCEQ